MSQSVFANSGNVFPLHQITHASDAWEVEWGSLLPCDPSRGVWVPWQGKECGATHAVDEDNYEPHHIKTPFELLDLGPDELPSIGSKEHATGECKRCAFFSKGRCQNGKECSHCHFPHDERRRQRKNRRKAGACCAAVNAAEANFDDAGEETSGDSNAPSVASTLSIEQAYNRLGMSKLSPGLGMNKLSSVSLPSQAQYFDSTIAFGAITPEEQITVQPSHGLICLPTAEEEASDISRAKGDNAFSSLFGVAEESASVRSKSQVTFDNCYECFYEDTEDVTSNRIEKLALYILPEEDMENNLVQRMEKISENDRSASSPNMALSSPNMQLLEKEMREAEEEAVRLETEALSAELEVQCIQKAKRFTPEHGEGATLLKDNAKQAAEDDTTEGSDESACESAEQLSFESDNGEQILSESDRSLCSSSSELQKVSSPKEQSVRPQGRRLHSPLWPSRAPQEADVENSQAPSEEGLAKEGKAPPKSWAAAAQERREHGRSHASRPEDDASVVARRARGILNKLTEKRFDVLYEQLLDCGIHTKAQLEAVVMEIFEKATVQHNFLVMYVELATRMNLHFKKNPIEGCDFRKILVGACQQTFEINLRASPPPSGDLSYEDQYEAQVKFKTRMLGNLRFVGELLVRKLLVGKILLAVAEELLSIGDGASIEAAVTLLEVAGPSFDRDSWAFVSRLRAIFSMLRPMSKEPSIPMRVRCIVKDLLDYRDRGWCTKAPNPNVPTVMPSRKF